MAYQVAIDDDAFDKFCQRVPLAALKLLKVITGHLTTGESKF